MVCLSNLEGKIVQGLTSHQQRLEVGDFNQHTCNLGGKVRSVDETLLAGSLLQDEFHKIEDEVAEEASLCHLISTSELLAHDELCKALVVDLIGANHLLLDLWLLISRLDLLNMLWHRHLRCR